MIDREILQRKVRLRGAQTSTSPDGDLPKESSLHFCMLGCEDNPPYGPNEATAALFLDLLCNAILVSSACNSTSKNSSSHSSSSQVTVSISIFRAQKQDYPDAKEWDEFDGIIIPGSFSSAYETEPWIETLKEVIQVEIHAKKRKTLAVCFGHQLFSHSFQGSNGGLCTPCPSGHHAGRRSSSLTVEGQELLKSSQIQCKNTNYVEMIYTHGDMVQKLPPCAVALFGNDHQVPIQAAAYFGSEDDATSFRTYVSSGVNIHNKNPPKPYAFTFQAHPEYSSDDGLNVTFTNILTALGERQALPKSELQEAKVDTVQNFSALQQESIRLTACVGRILGWFK